MKRLIISIIIFGIYSVSAAGLSSYYGLSGLNFIPSARTGESLSAEVAVTSAPATASNFSMYPFSVHGYITLLRGVQIGLTNTYAYYQEHDQLYFDSIETKGGGFVAGSKVTVIPFIPSLKLSFLDTAVPNGSLGVGFELPFGAFLCFDYSLSFSENYSLYIVGGLSSTYLILYGFGGVQMDLPYGFSVLVEGAYGGKTDYLTTAQESFTSAGMMYSITENVRMNFVFRIDKDRRRRLVLGYTVAY